MRTLNFILVAILGLLAIGVALAQSTVPAEPALSTDIRSWFGDTLTLAGVVVAAVAFLKTHVLRDLHDIATVLVSLAIGAGLGVVGHFLDYLSTGLVGALAFGLSAGFLASGGWDAVAGLVGKRKPVA